MKKQRERRSRSNLLNKKYKTTFFNQIYLFSYFEKFNSERDLRFKSLVRSNQINVLSLPSSFTLIKEQRVQGPLIKIIYGSQINFTKFQCFYPLKGTLLKFGNHWYLYKLFHQVKIYDKSPIVSKNIGKNLSLNYFCFFQFFSNPNYFSFK
jgi:hypothetical protein